MGNEQSSRAVPETGVVEELRVERITQKYLRRYPNSKRTRSWAGCMVHISTDRGVWRTNAEGYTYRGRADAWVLPFEEAQKKVAHCGPEKEASFIKVRAADALEAKDRELAEALAGYALVAKHNAEIEAEHEETFDKLTTAERERDEALAALREKEERVKALEDVLEPFAKAAKDCDVSDDLRIGVVKPADVIWESAVAVSITFGHVDRARSAMENSKAALADANSNQSTQNIGKNVSEDGQPVSGSREQRGNEEG